METPGDLTVTIDPTLLTALIAVVLSIISLLLWGFREGVALPLEYRESENAVQKRKEIDTILRGEVQDKLEAFLKSLETSEKDEKARTEILEDLGWSAYLANWATDTLLEGMTREMSLAIRSLSIGAFGVVATVLYAFFIVDLTRTADIIIVLILAAIDVMPFYLAVNRLRNNYSLRMSFVKLHESPNLEKCEALVDELQKKELW